MDVACLGDTGRDPQRVTLFLLDSPQKLTLRTSDNHLVNKNQFMYLNLLNGTTDIDEVRTSDFWRELMNWKAWTPLAVAIVLGLIAARLAMNVVTIPGDASVSHDTPMADIVVTTKDVPAGATLGVLDLKLAKIDAASVPVGAFTDVNAAMAKVARIALTPGQPILPSVLTEEGAGYGISATLPPGYRAITLEINDVSGVAGFITPKSRVDIVTTIQIDGKPTAKTLLESIEVLACGTRTDPNAPAAEAAKTVTLLVTPEDAERIELIVSSSRVRLILRNGRDKGRLNSDGITLAELKSGKSDEKSAPVQNAVSTGTDPFATPMNTSNTGPTTQPAKTNWTVEIIKAGQQSTQQFEVPVAPPQEKPADKQEPRKGSFMTQIGSVFSN